MVLTCEYCYKLVACKLQRKSNDETFYKMNKPDFKGLFKFIHVAMAAAHMPLNQKKTKFGLLTLHFGNQGIQGFKEIGE